MFCVGNYNTWSKIVHLVRLRTDCTLTLGRSFKEFKHTDLRLCCSTKSIFPQNMNFDLVLLINSCLLAFSIFSVHFES